MCLAFLQTGACAQGINCPLAHSVFESWLHPSRFRTQLCCFGASCKRRICFFGEPTLLLGAARSSHSTPLLLVLMQTVPALGQPRRLP